MDGDIDSAMNRDDRYRLCVLVHGFGFLVTSTVDYRLSNLGIVPENK